MMYNDEDEEDKRPPGIHLLHGYGHTFNAVIKQFGWNGIETWDNYKSRSPEKASKGPWPKKVDVQRASYHFMKYQNKMANLIYNGVLP